MAADGCIKRKNRVTLSQSGKNGFKLIQHVRNTLKLRNKISRQKPKNGDWAYTINVVSNALTTALRKYNIVPNKSLIYKFPAELPNKYIKDFIRGYLEGDGCITFYTRKSGYKGLTVSLVGTKGFISQIAKIMPIQPSIHPCKKSPVYVLSCGGKKALKLCDWIFSSSQLYHSYKYDTFIKYLDYVKTYPNRIYNQYASFS